MLMNWNFLADIIIQRMLLMFREGEHKLSCYLLFQFVADTRKRLFCIRKAGFIEGNGAEN